MGLQGKNFTSKMWVINSCFARVYDPWACMGYTLASEINLCKAHILSCESTSLPMGWVNKFEGFFCFKPENSGKV